jgi:hypothetical protein
MKASDLQVKPEVGQYWLNTRSLKLHKVTQVLHTLVTFDESSDTYTPPLGPSFVYLWFTGYMDLDGFISNPPMKPTPGQIWVSNDEHQNLLLVHPDQTNLPKPETVRVLSDSSHLFGLAFPLLNPIQGRPVVDSVWKDVLRNQLLAIKEGFKSPDEVYNELITQLAPRGQVDDIGERVLNGTAPHHDG